jgi:hypothetical protein
MSSASTHHTVGPREALALAEHEFEQYRLSNCLQTSIDMDLALAQVRVLASIANSLTRIADAAEKIAKKT